MNPTAPAQRLAEKSAEITLLEGIYDDLEHGATTAAISALMKYRDAAIQEATKELHTEKDDWQLRCRNAIDHWHREAELLVAERDQLRADLAAAYEREKVLREGAMRDAALRTVAEEMAGALNTLTTRYSLLCRDAKCVNIATDELITRADAALASYARLQKEKTP